MVFVGFLGAQPCHHVGTPQMDTSKRFVHSVAELQGNSPPTPPRLQNLESAQRVVLAAPREPMTACTY